MAPIGTMQSTTIARISAALSIISGGRNEADALPGARTPASNAASNGIALGTTRVCTTSLQCRRGNGNAQPLASQQSALSARWLVAELRQDFARRKTAAESALAFLAPGQTEQRHGTDRRCT